MRAPPSHMTVKGPSLERDNHLPPSNSISSDPKTRPSPSTLPALRRWRVQRDGASDWPRPRGPSLLFPGAILVFIPHPPPQSLPLLAQSPFRTAPFVPMDDCRPTAAITGSRVATFVRLASVWLACRDSALTARVGAGDCWSVRRRLLMEDCIYSSRRRDSPSLYSSLA